jgi:hypothetical protein
LILLGAQLLSNYQDKAMSNSSGAIEQTLTSTAFVHMQQARPK